ARWKRSSRSGGGRGDDGENVRGGPRGSRVEGGGPQRRPPHPRGGAADVRGGRGPRAALHRAARRGGAEGHPSFRRLTPRPSRRKASGGARAARHRDFVACTTMT